MLFFDPAKIPAPAPISNHSPSQVKTFELCERLWTFQSLHKLRAPPKPNLLLGSAIHKQIENWFLAGVEPPSPLAYASLQNLPVRGSGLIAIEKPLDKKGPPDKDGKPTRVPALYTGVIPWTGYIDLLYQPLGVTNSIQVWDHKTTTNLMWALESAKLKTDIQLNTYAKYAFDQEPTLERVDLFHNYLVTSTMNKTEVRANYVTREENAVVWKHIESRAHEMQVISDMALQSADVNFWQRAKANYDSCSAFGGCAFRDLCDKHKPPTSSRGLYDFGDEKLPTNGEKQQMAASDILKAKIAATQNKVDSKPAQTVMQTGSPIVPTVAVTKVAAPPAAPKQNAAMAMLMAKKAQAAVGAVATGTQTSILPPDAPVQGIGIAAPPTMIENPVEDLTDDAASAAALAPETTETAEAKGKRTRRTKAQMEADRAASEAAGTKITEVTGTLPANVTLQSISAPLTSTPRGFILCLGCAPVMAGESAVSLEFIISQLQEKIVKQANIANLHVLDYGKKASLLTEALKAYDFNMPVYTFTTNDVFLEGIISNVMISKAQLVIRGVR